MTTLKAQKVPHGMEPYDEAGPNDLGALSKEQQDKLNTFKVDNVYLSIIILLTNCSHYEYDFINDKNT